MLKKHLTSYNILTEEEIDNFISLVSYKKLNKGDFFIQEGNTCKEVAFIASGIFRSFYHSSDEKEATYCLLSENSFVTAYSSFISQTKTNENIQALTDAELYSITKEQFVALENSSSNWLRLFKIFAEQEYINLENRIFVLQNESAENRYKKLLETHPNYLKTIPLQYLASYLGITQRHLSRIRKSVFY